MSKTADGWADGFVEEARKRGFKFSFHDFAPRVTISSRFAGRVLTQEWDGSVFSGLTPEQGVTKIVEHFRDQIRRDFPGIESPRAFADALQERGLHPRCDLARSASLVVVSGTFPHDVSQWDVPWHVLNLKGATLDEAVEEVVEAVEALKDNPDIFGPGFGVLSTAEKSLQPERDRPEGE